MIDLRSDTVTKPTDEMRRAMYTAEVGDDVFAEDPTIKALEERVAELLGKEAALYVPSGTMANQIALAILTEDGDEVYCDESAHIFNYEGGAPAMVARVQLHPVPGEHGIYTRDQVEQRLRPANHHFAPSRVISVENTSNRGGGSVWPLKELRRLRELADENEMLIHLDGARLWNAAAASGTTEDVWASYADVVNVCFSKGLGAPVGSAVVGSREMIDKAHQMRKRLGGGMRQAGIIAAGALYAVENHRERLVEDHRRAKTLAEGIAGVSGFDVDPERVQTNIVIVDMKERSLEASSFAETASAEGLLVTLAGQYKVRFVTHLGVNDEDIQKAIRIVQDLYG
jgi:threonine aldolase